LPDVPLRRGDDACANSACSQHRRRRLLSLLLALTSLVLGLSPVLSGSRASGAQTTAYHNPLISGSAGAPLSCPDPDVFRVPWENEYVAACTSDYGQANPGGAVQAAALPMYVSHDLEHWSFQSFIFPPGHQPWLAEVGTGRASGGRYWSPEIHRIGGRWIVYFGARIVPDRFRRVYHQTVEQGTFGLFVAWTDRLSSGRWHSSLLHYAGQFNAVPGNPQEVDGGVIDPSVARDPRTGQLYIAYAKQNNQIIIGKLNADGLTMETQLHVAFGPRYSWQCDPGPLGVGTGCCVEGPVLYADPQHQVLDMFFNSASTWRGTYKVGVAVTTDPMHHWTMYPQPILQSGNGLFGPGIGAQPVTAPDGATYMFFHVQLHPSHDAQARYLALGRLHYVAGDALPIPFPGATPTISPQTAPYALDEIPVPQVENGVVPRQVLAGGPGDG
jgi:arabinan endo-1,5-alpha-L-arabinosidase